jgi:CARDB
MKTRFALFSVLVLLIAAAGAGIQQGPGGKEVKVKPDIIITELSIVPPTVTPVEAYNIRVKVTVSNPNKGSATGPFKVLCEWTENPTAGYTRLGEAGVADLVNSPALAAAPVKTLYFDHSVPRGKSYKYRVTADSTSMVVETDETNNIKSIGFTAR